MTKISKRHGNSSRTTPPARSERALSETELDQVSAAKGRTGGTLGTNA